MIGIFVAAIMTLLVQAQTGPRNLQLAENAVVKPPIIVPMGTVIPVALVNRLSTKYAKDGDGIYARTTFPITINNQIVIPVGAHVRGKITAVQRPGRVKGKAALALSFQSLIMPNGTTLPLYASLGGASGSGEREGEATVKGDSSKTKDAGTIGTTGATGAVIGGIGSHGKGAAIGGATGAGVGLATVLLTRGQELVLEPGATIEIVLDQPLEL